MLTCREASYLFPIAKWHAWESILWKGKDVIYHPHHSFSLLSRIKSDSESSPLGSPGWVFRQHSSYLTYSRKNKAGPVRATQRLFGMNHRLDQTKEEKKNLLLLWQMPLSCMMSCKGGKDGKICLHRKRQAKTTQNEHMVFVPQRSSVFETWVCVNRNACATAGRRVDPEEKQFWDPCRIIIQIPWLWTTGLVRPKDWHHILNLSELEFPCTY